MTTTLENGLLTPPLPNLPTPELRETINNGPDDTYDPSPVETAATAWIQARDRDAKGRSQYYRLGFNLMMAMRWAEVPSARGADGFNEYVLPIVGWMGTRLAEAIHTNLIPDPQEMDGFYVNPSSQAWQNVATVEEIKALHKAALALEMLMRDGLKDAKAYEKMRMFIEHFVITGNAVMLAEWRRDLKTVALSPDELVQMIEGMQDDLEANDEPLPTRKTVITHNHPEIVIMDPRNTFPSSNGHAEGISDLPYVTFYKTTTWRQMAENRVRRQADGTVIGSYANTKCFSPSMETDVREIYWDMPITWAQAPAQLRFAGGDVNTDWLWNMSRGFEVQMYVGDWYWERVMVDNEMPTQREVDAFLRKFGNDPAECRDVRYWLAEVVMGKLVRFGPYPYFKGDENPIISAGMYFRPGRTFRAGIYQQNANIDQIFNYFLVQTLLASDKTVNPPWLMDRSMIDGKTLNQIRNGFLNLAANQVVQGNAGADVSKIFQPIMPPPGAMQSAGESMEMVKGLTTEFTGVGPTVMGEGPSGGATATTATLQSQTGNAIVGYHSKTVEDQAWVPLLNQVAMLYDEWVRPNQRIVLEKDSDIERMAKYDEEISGQLAMLTAQGREAVAPIIMPLQTTDFHKGFAVRVKGGSAGGGKAARVSQIDQAIGMISQLDPNTQQTLDVQPLIMAKLEMVGLGDLAEEMRLSQAEQMMRQQQQVQQAAQMNAAGGEPGQGAGQASPPRADNNFNPVRSVGGTGM